jgi:hypothetical protein
MVNQSIAAHIRTIPGVPVSNERQTSEFKTVQVDGSRLTVSPQRSSDLAKRYESSSCQLWTYISGISYLYRSGVL